MRILQWSRFYLRVDPPEDNKVACIGGEVDNSLGGGAHTQKQRNRETKMVLSIVEQAYVFVVWPRHQNGIPLPTNKPRASSGGGTSSTNYKTKPVWVEHHLVVILIA